jgi:hypothetical protein
VAGEGVRKNNVRTIRKQKSFFLQWLFLFIRDCISYISSRLRLRVERVKKVQKVERVEEVKGVERVKDQRSGVIRR